MGKYKKINQRITSILIQIRNILVNDSAMKLVSFFFYGNSFYVKNKPIIIAGVKKKSVNQLRFLYYNKFDIIK